MSTETAQSIPEEVIRRLIDQAFQEDIGNGDVTTDAIVDEYAQAEACWKAKDEGIVAGLEIARQVFERLDPQLEWKPETKEGQRVSAGSILTVMQGATRALLTAERIALNIVQRMSGIATRTRQYVAAVGELDTVILDTRKTAPGLRLLDKYAVKTGGGQNHRMGLYDLAMIKDNHIIAAGGIAEAVEKVRRYAPGLDVEVETTTLRQVEEALGAEADIIMLDNMSNKLMQKAVKKINGRAKTEASGNITLHTVREVAETGVDYVSVGALTHSVEAFDISQTLQQLK
ncbi:carboxylating nicotinate-nucleotide diphosphorylase [Fodinibius sediminis]|uniref:Probable nicotinate-nucleotide pyrophosphorylase [carboxylating] n=1 Tax=Fodinibius sediminis TaxID=1214077 RepID=A0A521D307_9BACT|nr:carboxylating nicotinate-nucleotide diphosphorylase [Fodinibius sediminis]SMO66037.1 nicotinate-nucleotide pyrophosphorylase [carboxylating] [Fodinibius sediminis]